MQSICEALLSVEQDLALFEWQVKGVYVWPLIRMPLYYQLTKRLSVFGAPHGSARWRGRRLTQLRLWCVAALSYLTRPKRPCELLIFDHPRKVSRGDRSVDIYTEHIIEALSARQVNIEVYEHLSYMAGDHALRDYPRGYYDLIATASARLSRLLPLTFTREDLTLVDHVAESLKARLGVEVNLKRLIKRRVSDFLLRRRLYLRLLKAHQPKALLVVVSYSTSISPLIDAARSLSIPSIEMQHGTFSAYHLGYHFPGLSAHPYFCDTLFTFGDFWSQMASLPIPSEEVRVYGFRHMSEQLRVPQRPWAEREEVLFLSQGVIGEGLARYASACAIARLPWRLVYKLHPSEYASWRETYPQLAALDAEGLIEVIDHAHYSLYKLMGRARCQVGVFSTAVYEGLALGCKTLLVDLPGLEYMRPLIARGDAELITGPEALVERLRAEVVTGDEAPKHSEAEPLEVFASPHEETLSWLLKRLGR